MKESLGNNKQQVVAHSNPNLCVNGIACRAIEGLYMKAAFQEFEERLDGPSLAIKFCDCECRKIEIISKKCVNIICCIIFISHHPERLWVPFRGQLACKTDVLVANETGDIINRPFTNDFVLHVALGSGDKESMLLMKQLVESLKVDVAFVHQIIGEGLDRQLIHRLTVMYLTLCQMDECGYATSETEQRVHLKGTFAMMELCPGTQFETQLNRTAVEGIHHLVDIKTIVVVVIKFSCLLDKVLGEIMIDSPVLFLVHLAESRAWNKAQARMIQLLLERCQGSLVRAETLLGGQLCEAHDHELVTTAEPNLVTVAIVPSYALAEEILWEQRHDLGEDTLTLIHMILTLHYYQMQKYKIKSSKNSIAVNHCNLTTYLTKTGFSPDNSDIDYKVKKKKQELQANTIIYAKKNICAQSRSCCI